MLDGDWSSDVCSSDLHVLTVNGAPEDVLANIMLIGDQPDGV
jgi:hypothetical protein